jgi:hypothetical protein
VFTTIFKPAAIGPTAKPSSLEYSHNQRYTSKPYHEPESLLKPESFEDSKPESTNKSSEDLRE